MADRTRHHTSNAAPAAQDTQGARRATGGACAAGEAPRQVATEVLEKASRRTFTAQYKQRILAQADACSEPGCIGKLLRSEGLYSSHLSKWRSEREQAIRAGLSKQR